ncbi:hypothetical protein EYR36_001863 [Pleurotus pulmonarius]|nr:hypothetical protein EYR36_001863 [Pleurotus pulmonarius]KAF4588382.1 hypothetical protein EYR38_010350 [Pleurotus pulmonarius]
MDAVVPAEITAELTQILSNLVLGDNEIRSNAEKAVNERLAHTPELYLLALAQFAITADTEVMRSFSLVLLRRLLFRPKPVASPSSPSPNQPRSCLYDHLPTQSLTTLERLLLHSLAHEPSPSVRPKSVDTVCDLANQSMNRGRPWHALQAQIFSMAQQGESGDAILMPGAVKPELLRESAYRVFTGCPNLVMDLQTDAVLSIFQRGLQDPYSVEVRYASLSASVAYLSACDPHQLAQSLALVHLMLDTLPALATPSQNPSQSHSNTHHLAKFLTTLTPLCSSHPSLFEPHLQALLRFLPALLTPAADCGPTPTVAKPFPISSDGGSNGRQTAFVFPPTSPPAPSGGEPSHDPSADPNDTTDDDDERAALRLATLEFMVSLSEARPGMVKKVNGWVGVIVRACLEGMGEFDESESTNEGLQSWLNDDPSSPTNATTLSADTESTPALYEQSLDRLACATGGRAVLPPAFIQIPSMLASYDWRIRHAGLMAIASIAEGTGKVMLNELGKVVDLVIPMFRDTHPRVRYAACQCVGQLCTDLEEVIQAKYHEQLFSALIPTLEDPEPRVHSHAAAALINFCEGVERDTLVPYLDPIVERLLKLLNPQGDPSTVRRYVQEQAVTTLAMVADASEVTFAKHYPSIMPLLLSILQNAEGPSYRKLRAKAMECAGLIAIAVGRETFRPDSNSLIESLIRIQNLPPDPNDTEGHYLIATWAKVCQAMGPEFEPYLPVVMQPLLTAANAKADISVYDDDQEQPDDRNGWETLPINGQNVSIRTSAIDEKCQAFETLLIYCSTLGPRFAPYLPQTLELTLPSLKFYFHEGVREACAMLIPMLLACGKTSGTLTNQMVSATFLQLINCISTEYDASFLASLYKCFTDSVQVLGGVSALSPEFHEGVIEATKRQLQSLAEKRKTRSHQASMNLEDSREEMALMEEIEDFSLEEVGKMLQCFDQTHPLLVAVTSVRELGFNTWDSEDEGEEEG